MVTRLADWRRAPLGDTVANMPTPASELAAELLGMSLSDWVAQQRAAGLSWDLVSRELYVATDHRVGVTGEWLRRLFAVP